MNRSEEALVVYKVGFNKSVIFVNVADPDPGSGAFLPPGSGSGMNFFWISDPGSIGYRYVFGEIFLRILVLLFFY
jgi:hypothetical protein